LHLAQTPGCLSSSPTVESYTQLGALWGQLLEARREISRALEEARADKLIGHSLDAAVTISADGGLCGIFEKYKDDLRSFFIVSKVSLVKDGQFEKSYDSPEIENLKIFVEKAPGQKCERCWVYDSTVGDDDKHPGVCARCKNVLKSSFL